MRCGEKNKADPGWPDRVPHGCNQPMLAVQYTTLAGTPGVVFLCPKCDSPA